MCHCFYDVLMGENSLMSSVGGNAKSNTSYIIRLPLAFLPFIRIGQYCRQEVKRQGIGLGKVHGTHKAQWHYMLCSRGYWQKHNVCVCNIVTFATVQT